MCSLLVIRVTPSNRKACRECAEMLNCEIVKVFQVRVKGNKGRKEEKKECSLSLLEIISMRDSLAVCMDHVMLSLKCLAARTTRHLLCEPVKPHSS